MNPSPPTHDSTDVVLELRSVTRRIEAFFEHQMQKLRTAMQQLEEVQAEFNVARRMSAGLESQRETFLRERDREMDRLTRASEMLARSWTELEQKQRDLAIESGGNPHAPHPEKPPVAEPPGVPAADSGLPESENTAGEMDLFQMQQLQAQVNQHKKRRR